MNDDVAIDQAFWALGLDWHASGAALVARASAADRHVTAGADIGAARRLVIDFTVAMRAHDAALIEGPGPLRRVQGVLLTEAQWRACRACAAGERVAHAPLHPLAGLLDALLLEEDEDDDDGLLDDPGVDPVEAWECAPTRLMPSELFLAQKVVFFTLLGALYMMLMAHR